MFTDIHVDIFQLYDVSKGKKKSSLTVVSHTKQISFDKFYAWRVKKKDLEMTSNNGCSVSNTLPPF